MAKIALPNGCSCSEPRIHPMNFKSKNAMKVKDWFIQYRFYDVDGHSKQKIIRGMNRFSGHGDKVLAAKAMLESEIELLLSGYNPFTDMILAEDLLSEYTPFKDALALAQDRLNLTIRHLCVVKSILKSIGEAASKLHYDSIPVSQIKRRHLKFIFDRLKKDKPKWNATTFNLYRNKLMLVYSELVELDIVESNIVKDIKKQIEVKLIRQTLSVKERKKVKQILSRFPEFYRYVNIFFHAGVRNSELLRLKVSDVDLKAQYYKITILKGNNRREELKPIKDIALPFWKKQLKRAKPEDYVFSVGLKPGSKMIRYEQISERWKRHIKSQGITCDFYSLKHLALDETAAILSAKDAARMASHTTPVVTIAHYLKGEKDRQMERIKKVNNPFA